MIQKLYYWSFRKVTKVQPRYCFPMFHINGIFAFIISLKKHISRRSYHMIPKQIRGILWQVKELFKSLPP
jgi:hypothetical protein